jgi:NADPH:quinone reductase-like Zn-dependent oxidoreductase
MTRPLQQVLAATSCMAALMYTAGAAAQAPSPGAPPRMKAIVYRTYGDALRLEDVARPVCDDNQVLVKIRAASVNPLDVYYARGTPYLVRTDAGLFEPTVQRLGVDLAGQVEAVGRNVTRFEPGDEVFGHRFGAFAEYACASERALATKPANLTFEQAASVPVAAITALQGLRDRGRIRPGHKVLVNGASGGVGTFAVQIAKALGAEVTGVCSTKNVDLVRSIGADHVVDYTQEDFTRSGQRYDLILDMVANHSPPEYRRVMSPQGIHVVVGSVDKGLWLKPFIPSFRGAVYSLFVSQEFVGMLARINAEDLTVLRDLMQAGKVTPVIDRAYGLGEVPEAIRYVERGHARGKVVITVDHAGEVSPAGAAPAAGPVSPFGARLVALALVAFVGLAPLAAALALNRRFARSNPGKRPYRWGYFVSLQALIGGIALGILLESGAGVAIACGVVYAVLAWAFARRRRWAWVALTILSLNPVAWVINFIYLRKRWAEDSVAIPKLVVPGPG